MWLNINTYYIWYISITYLSNWQNFKNTICRFVIKHISTPTQRHIHKGMDTLTCTVPLFFFSFIRVCVCITFIYFPLSTVSDLVCDSPVYLFLFGWNPILTNSLQMHLIHPSSPFISTSFSYQDHWTTEPLAPMASSLAEAQWELLCL